MPSAPSQVRMGQAGEHERSRQRTLPLDSKHNGWGNMEPPAGNVVAASATDSSLCESLDEGARPGVDRRHGSLENKTLDEHSQTLKKRRTTTTMTTVTMMRGFGSMSMKHQTEATVFKRGALHHRLGRRQLMGRARLEKQEKGDSIACISIEVCSYSPVCVDGLRTPENSRYGLGL